jgi:hypothetical protein
MRSISGGNIPRTEMADSIAVAVWTGGLFCRENCDYVEEK